MTIIADFAVWGGERGEHLKKFSFYPDLAKEKVFYLRNLRW